MVPKGWVKKQIGDIALIQVGRDLKEDNYSEFQTDRHIYPVYSNTVEQRGLYGYYDFAEYSGGAVTIVGRGIGLGTAFARYEDENYGAIGRLLVLSPKNNSFDVGYFADYINFSLHIHNESGGIPQLPGASLAKYFVLLPPLEEQRKIAQILSTWDKAITTTERLLANRQQQKKALMQRLLTGKQRFAGFEGEWKKYLQGNVATFHNGRAYKLSEWEETGTPVIRLQNLTGRGSDFYYSNLALPARQYCESGDLLYMWSATFGPHIWQGPKAIYHYHIWKIECSVDVLHKEFMFYVLNFETQRWLSKSNGMGLLHITKETMEKQTILLPSLKEQQKIASVLSAADAEISTIQNQLDNLKQQKKALMQQLLTGKRRVKVDSPALATQ